MLTQAVFRWTARPFTPRRPISRQGSAWRWWRASRPQTSTRALEETERPKLDVLFEDETILVVNKPAGLLSVATNKMEDDTLHSRCVAHVRANHGERAGCTSCTA